MECNRCAPMVNTTSWSCSYSINCTKCMCTINFNAVEVCCHMISGFFWCYWPTNVMPRNINDAYSVQAPYGYVIF